MTAGNTKPVSPSSKSGSGASSSLKNDKAGAAKNGSATSKRNSQGGEQKSTGSKSSK